ncbi:MAG: 3-dehydroquinate synthase [Flavobacteriaceae bacterium]|jgi:3-dehydroquinate synthase|nr:3-dehydroquinate synthase [Flavobacteriaceae bacterium]
MKEIIKNKGAVYCSSNNWVSLNNKIKEINPSTIFIIVDTNTKKDCLPLFFEKETFNESFEVLEIPAGEINKNINTCSLLWNKLSENGADRNSLIINLGGGVVTDLGGFVASTFKRGVFFINIPTTLLAMVDASVGGKNGVDLGLLKNQIGIINNSEMVLIDIDFLKTLPKNQIASGLAEMIKHGLIHSREYWDKVKSFDILKMDELEDLIWESVLIKNDVITKDPLEKNLRKTLNYGHTLGHAIESYSLDQNKFPALSHGEAIAIGMVLTTYISHKQLGFPEQTLSDISNHINKWFNKSLFNKEAINAVIELLKFDKKNYNGKVLFVLLNDIGNYKLNCEVSNLLILEAFEYYKNYK